jgi:hypothetical protein
MAVLAALNCLIEALGAVVVAQLRLAWPQFALRFPVSRAEAWTAVLVGLQFLFWRRVGLREVRLIVLLFPAWPPLELLDQALKVLAWTEAVLVA